MCEPRRIVKLDENVINKIAAGEIIQRPANAIKELLENSLDAGSSQIIISVKQGGLGLIQVQDNGCGIHKEDFPVLCERFTTSKLREFQDLLKIQTFGFRGEALASMTHVAHVAITSKTVDSVCSYKGIFCESKLLSPPQPCAGTTGTTVRVEDLFYNVPVRKNSLKNTKDEFAKIKEVVSHYAILNASRCSMTLKRIDDSVSSNPDVRVTAGMSIEDCIVEFHGGDLTKQLLPLEYKSDKLGYSISGRTSKPGYNARKLQLILFINSRLVHCDLLKKSMDNLYSNILPKKTFPFIFLHLEIPSSNVDVNVHPTKNEVHFLHQELIVADIQEFIEKLILSASESRSFVTQSLLNKSSHSNTELSKTRNFNNKSFLNNSSNSIHSPSASFSESFRPSEKIRSDPTLRKINAFFQTNEKLLPKIEASVSEMKKSSYLKVNESTKEMKDESVSLPLITADDNPTRLSEPINLVNCRRKFDLTALSNLRDSIVTTNLCDWRNFVYVGMIDKDRILIQRDTELLLVHTPTINYNLFYQLTLHHFGNFGQIEILDTETCENRDDRTLLSDLFVYGLREAGQLYKDIDSDASLRGLVENAQMLEDYFAIKIDCKKMTLVTIPIVLDKFIPDLRKLPKFIFNLCTKVNWQDEQECLRSICREIAEFYSFGIGNNTSLFADKKQFEQVFENIVLPMYRDFVQLPVSFEQDGTLVRLTSLPELYKIFERC